MLIDFGTAREMTASYLAKLQQGNITGIISRGFTPSEQMHGEAVLQSDFFALGRTFAQLLTAKDPLDMYAAAIDQFKWRQYTQNVSPELLDLIDKMMAKLTSDRHQNTAELLKDIARVRKIVLKRRTNMRVVSQPQGLGRRDLLLLLGGSSFAAVIAWEKLKPNPSNTSVAIKEPSPQPPSPVATPSLVSSQNEPVPPSPTPTPANKLQTQTLNNIITVDSYGKETNRRTVQVQYFVEDKVILPSGAKAIKMALIVKGKFDMGRPNSEKGYDSELPQHEVKFPKDFYMGRYAVTQAQWLAVTGKFNKRADAKFKGANRPMICVSWHKAREFCKKINFSYFH